MIAARSRARSPCSLGQRRRCGAVLPRCRAAVAALCAGRVALPLRARWDGEDRVAVLATDGPQLAAQAFVYAIDEIAPADGSARPTGETYPLVNAQSAGFANVSVVPPRYPIVGDNADERGMRALRRLSRVTSAGRERSRSVFRQRGAALCLAPALPRSFNSGPRRIRLWALADDAADLRRPAKQMRLPGACISPVRPPQTPQRLMRRRAAWLPAASELPFAPALLPCPSAPDRAGLFTLLLQRPGRRVRRCKGGSSGFASSFWATATSPRRCCDPVAGKPFLLAIGACQNSTASRSPAPMQTPKRRRRVDFLERFLCLFEGPLTEIEDKVAGAWLLTDPAAAPPAALPWLGRWIGIDIDVADDQERARQALQAAPYTARLMHARRSPGGARTRKRWAHRERAAGSIRAPRRRGRASWRWPDRAWHDQGAGSIGGESREQARRRLCSRVARSPGAKSLRSRASGCAAPSRPSSVPISPTKPTR